MSKTIDQRVVEMRFDHRHFEKNAKETLSLLDKLKEKLNFKGASKGLEEINTSANKVNFKGMSDSLETVQAKFSALQVVGVTALANITNSAVNAGKRLLSSLTIDNVATGWDKYAQKTSSVQTIMNATGKSIDEVNTYLEKLMWFSDETSYGFTDMTAGLATMVSSGGDIEKLIPLITGVANATAFAGKGAAEFSRVLQYGINQAYSLGYMQVQDWKTIEGATVNSKQLMQTLIDAGVALGKIKKGQVDISTFRSSLKDQWLDKEVMEAGFGKFAEFSEAVYKAVEDGTYETATEAIEALSDKYEELGVKAFTSAQEAKTFTEAIDATKDALGSAFMRIFESIFGNYEQAKKLWTDLAYKLYDIFVAPVVEFEERLAEALSYNPFTALLKKLEDSGIGKFAKKINKITGSLEEYQKMVNKIWRGDYNNRGDNPDRFDLLEKEGWNPHVLQNLVNKGYQYKLTVDDVAAAEKKWGVTTEATTEIIESLTDAQLKEIGLTEEEIEMYRDLEKQSEKTGKSISELIQSMEQKDGRTLLIESFKNIGNSILRIFKAIGDAWKNAFPPMSAIRIYNLIDGFNKLTSKLVMSDDTLEDLTRTFKGVFAILDLISMVLGGGFKIAFTVLKTVLGLFNLDILEFTAIIGDALVAVRDWIENNNIIVIGIKKLAGWIKTGVIAIKDWIVNNKKIADGLSAIKSKLSGAASAVKAWFEGLKEIDNIPKYILEGLVKGLKNGATIAFETIVEIGSGIIEAIKGVLGIHSPSTEFFEIGKNIMQGLFNGISEFVKMVYNLVISIGGKLIEIVRDLDIGTIFTILTGAGFVMAFMKIAKAVEILAMPFQGLNHLFFEAGEALEAFQGVLKSLKLRIMAESVKTFAVAIAILAGSIAVLSFLDPARMWSAIGAITVLMGLLAGLTYIANQHGGKQSVEFGKIALTLLGLAASMWIMARALKSIASIEPDKYVQTITAFAVIMGSLMGTMAIISRKGSSVYKAGSAFMGIATALLMMGIIAKILGGMDQSTLKQGTFAIVAFSAIIVGLIAATKLISGSKNVDKIGKTVSKIAGALLLMVIVAKIAGSMDEDTLYQGTKAIIAFGGIVVGLMAATKLIGDGKNVAKIGGAIFGVAGAMVMMVLVAKLASTMEPADLLKGVLVVAAFGGIVVGLMAATQLLDKHDISGVGRNMLFLAAAIGVLGITAALLGLVDIAKLAKGVVAVGFLALIAAGLISAAKSIPPDVTGTMIALTVAIGILAVALGVLSAINPERLINSAVSIGIVLGTLAVVLNSTGALSKSAIGGILSLTLVLGLVAGAIYLLAKLPIENTLGVTASLSLLLLSLSGALVILGFVGTLGPAAFIGIGALATLIVAIVGLVVGIGALMEHVPTLQSFLDTGLGVLIQIAGGIGEMIGAFVKGTITQISSSLPIIGTHLSQFMINAMPFITGAKMIDKSLVTSIASLAGAILIITATDVLNGLTSWLTGGNSIADFGSQLGELALCINQFANNLGTFDESKLKTITCASNAIKSLAQAAKDIPNEGGLWSKLAGENSLVSFGSQLPILATYLNGFIANLGTFDESKVTTIDCVGRAIKALATAANEIPNEGGLWSTIVGDNSLASFGSQLPGLGYYLNSFVSNLGTFTDAQVTTVDCAGRAIKSLATAAKDIPNEGGMWAAIVGENSLASFGNQLPGLGKNISAFVTNLGEFSEKQVATVNSACNAIKAISKLGEIDIKDTGKDMNSFGKNMIKFAGKVKDFVEQMTEVGAADIESAIKKTKEMIGLAKSAVSIDTKSLSAFGDSLKNIAKNGVKGFIKEFSGASTKLDAEKAGKALINSVIDGADDRKDDVKKKFKNIAENAVDELCTKSLKEDAKDAGKDLVQGLINGLKDVKKRNEVYAAAYSLGELAVKGEKDGQESNSPSKATERAGKWLGEGLVIGIQKMGSRVYGAGKSMGEEATNSISSALNTAINLLDSDMDTQPTIRPVLDLSEVESGAGYLNSMFNSQSIGVTSNLNAISSDMNSRSQNGTNNDVVYAINKLRKDLGNVGGDTYNVNGVTYDDGSNITEAVKTIVRAAIVERRI